MKRALTYYILTEFGPVLTFFIAAQYYSFFIATKALLITTILAFATTWFHEKRVPLIPCVSGLFVMIAGTITLIYQAPNALILSDSLYYLFVSTALTLSLYYKKLILKKFFGRLFAMHDTGWHIETTRLIYLCLIAGVLNEVIRIKMSVDFWMYYKFGKAIVITLFSIYQFKLVRAYRIETESNSWGLRNTFPAE
ncbi:MAG: intracellular septation protein [Candidatus Azotimanducaceae bacterium]|jgi:intracellular septation protein